MSTQHMSINKFEMPNGVVEVEIDSDTKKLPTSRTKKTELEAADNTRLYKIIEE